MRRLWLIFAQTVTVCVAVLFVVKTLKPEWLTTLPSASGTVSEVATVLEAPAGSELRRPGSYADAAKIALPAVVHIFTSQEVKGPRQPFINDPIFRHFFGDRFGEMSQRRSGLGSGVVLGLGRQFVLVPGGSLALDRARLVLRLVRFGDRHLDRARNPVESAAVVQRRDDAAQ